MRSMDGLDDTAGFYRHFAEHEADGSPTFAAWSAGVAADEEVLALLAGLPEPRRQPNLLFAAARWHGADAPSGYDELRRVLRGRWAQVRETMLTRTTQTNEVGRCATMLPVLAGLPGPLALIEVGASAGLCLHPDRYSYRYTDREGREVHRLDPGDGPSPVLLTCRLDGPGRAPLPPALPEVVWRGGLDLNPLDAGDPVTARWLETLVWPEHEDRRERLAAATALVGGPAGDPVHLRRGDAALLPEVVAQARREAPGATVVVLHSAVVAYFPDERRAAWPGEVLALQQQEEHGAPLRWVSQEGAGVLPGLTATASCPPEDEALFCLALDGRALGWVHGHGRSLAWC